MDSKAEIKIIFDIYGKKEKFDAYINYTPNDEGIDERIIKFFRDVYFENKSMYDLKIYEKEKKLEHKNKIKDAKKLLLDE